MLNRVDLSSRRNDINDGMVLTDDGRAFQARVAAAGKARSPIVQLQISWKWYKMELYLQLKILKICLLMKIYDMHKFNFSNRIIPIGIVYQIMLLLLLP